MPLMRGSLAIAESLVILHIYKVED